MLYPTKGIQGIIYTTLHFFLTCIPLVLILHIISLNKYVFSVNFPIFSLLGSIIGYYSFRYKAIFTPVILDATLNNDLRTSLDVVPAELIVYILIQLFITFLIVKYRYQKISIKKSKLQLVVSIALLILIFSINTRVKNTFLQHFPSSVFHNLYEYSLLTKIEKNENRINPDENLKAECADSTIVVLIIGESLRADHLSLNGYNRKTTPNLDKRNHLVSLSNIYSKYTYTNPSVAHILTRANEKNYELSKTEKSFITLFNQCGYQSSWIANQEANKYYYSFMKEADTLIYCNPDKSVYSYSKWLDEDLLPHFKRILKSNDNCKLIILHTIGSHWYYNNHFLEEFAKFKPITSSKVVAQNDSLQMVNSYDNTILYMDYFVEQVIQNIENKNSILIYLSDHGESYPASFIWFSTKYLNSHQKAYENLIQNKDKNYKTDFLYHSILNAGNIPSSVIDDSLNVFSCKNKLSEK